MAHVAQVDAAIAQLVGVAVAPAAVDSVKEDVALPEARERLRQRRRGVGEDLVVCRANGKMVK